MRKSKTSKYYIYFNGASNIADRIELTKKQFNEFWHQGIDNKKVAETNNPDAEEYEIVYYVDKKENDSYISTSYYFINGMAEMTLVEVECKEGYHFE